MVSYAWSIISLLGIVYALKLFSSFLLQIHAGLQAYVLPWVIKSPDFRVKFGEWGLVTGCTQGIGREYALGLAAKGMDVLLVSRNKKKLEDVQREIETVHLVKTKVIVADFTDVKSVPMVIKQVEDCGLDMGVLVNNVGTAGEHMMPFLDQDSVNVDHMISVNIAVITRLTHAFLPQMKRRGRGAIINISSVASLQPMPYIAVYAATKHYIHAFTEALRYENKDSGVTIQEVTPGAVDTALTRHLPHSRFNLRALPAQFVYSALETLGYSSQTCGWWPHSLQLVALQCIPGVVSRWGMRRALKYTYDVIIRNLENQKRK